ncbi:MAG: hypothetical protein AAF289_16670 [Cyanobacteria bacterium P01_A01_bin.135]
MSRLPQNLLKPNPFTTYRDPHTGRWVVVREQPAYFSQAVAKPPSTLPVKAFPASRVSPVPLGVPYSTD